MSCLAALVLLATVQGAKAEEADLVRIIKQSTREIEHAAPSIAKPWFRCMYWWEAGEHLGQIDDKRALSDLMLAWKIVQKDASSRSSWRGNVASEIANINPTFGRSLLKQGSKDDHDLDLVELSEAIAYRHPRLAAKLVPIHYGPSLFELVLHLAEIRPDIGAKFLKTVKGANIEDEAFNVAGNLPESRRTEFLSNFKFLRPANPGRLWSVQHPHATGPELEQAAAGMPLYDRVQLLVDAMKSYRATNPARSRKIADDLVGLAEAKGPSPVLRMPGFQLKGYERLLLPELALVDSPAVRGYLEKVTKSPSWRGRLTTARAWSYLDLERAKALVASILALDPGIITRPHGQMADDAYIGFLTNLAKAEPEEAAQALNKVQLLMDNGGTMKWVQAVGILDNLWQDHPAEASKFAKALGPYGHNKYADLNNYVELRQADATARKDPQHSLPTLREIFRRWPEGLSIVKAGPEPTTLDVAYEIGKTDIPGAIKLTSLFAKPTQRIDVLTTLFEWLRFRPYSERKKILNAAFDLAARLKDPEKRATSYKNIAAQAKTAWKRLQPWPPLG